MTDFEKNTLNKIGESAQNGELSNDSMVQIIKLLGGFLNLKTISDYAKANDLSYNGAKKCRQKVVLFGVKFIIDND
jgi:hypothetical protein